MSNDILAKLAAPFPPDVISWRVGSTTKDKARGMALAYIDARDVQDRLDQVCGENWQVRHPWAAGSKLACEIGIKIGDQWIWRGDGAGDSDVEAEKGAFSDSFKRAAVRWGVGRYLYDIDSPWVALEAAGNSYKIAPGEYERLRKVLASKSSPARVAAPEAPKPSAVLPPAPTAMTAAVANGAPTTAPHIVTQAKAIETELKSADSAHQLDLVMDQHRATMKTLPQVTEGYLNKLYERRRAAMEHVA